MKGKRKENFGITKLEAWWSLLMKVSSHWTLRKAGQVTNYKVAASENDHIVCRKK